MAQIGTTRLDTAGGAVSLPIFEIGDSDGTVYEMVRVETAGGTGFIPFADPADATYPYLRIETQNQGVLAAHDDVTTVTTQTIDDFEDNSMSEYTQNEVGGGSGIQTGTVKEGTYALEVANAGASDSSYVSQSGLNYYPSPGDTWRVWIRAGDSDGNPSHGWAWQGTTGVQGSGSGYRLFTSRDTDFSDEGLVLQRADNGSTTTLDETLTGNNGTVQTNTWYQFEIEWTSGNDLTGRLLDDTGSTLITVGPVNDSTYTSGGIIWLYAETVSANSSGFFDFARTI